MVYTGKKVQLITITSIFAALITVTTAYIFHIPVPLTGGYIHIGDGIIYLAATILPTPYAIIGAMIGGGLADLLT
ncbi:MAG: ECF transporter S component, partial [Clostridia bacterium]|nr:ECF transporter S component [Clostridia bacterium]